MLVMKNLIILFKLHLIFMDIILIIQGFLVGPMAKKWGLKSVINQGLLFLVIGLVLVGNGIVKL